MPVVVEILQTKQVRKKGATMEIVVRFIEVVILLVMFLMPAVVWGIWAGSQPHAFKRRWGWVTLSVLVVFAVAAPVWVVAHYREASRMAPLQQEFVAVAESGATRFSDLGGLDFGGELDRIVEARDRKAYQDGYIFLGGWTVTLANASSQERADTGGVYFWVPWTALWRRG